VRALPVKESELDKEPRETPVVPPRPERALPVGDDEVIDENIEDPQ
jgi:hypothetical protein